eukprot:TRINITY_DN1392_c0_g1_i2.p1 TRINITY_DN1392_c0_g1~~TRINITY_DN1392_c0_g1_i2.p1  ORF type:complete len:1088 (-),score=180.02 TRINITY_DN1392_c0_g1_i2:76-3297(-)
MEGIITKLLGGYLKKFIKDFNQEMLSLQIMKGQATMKDFELVGEALQELMMLPTNLEVVSAKCSLLSMAIPYMNLKHEPITLTIDRIDLQLREPDVIKPMPNTLASLNRSNLSEKAERMSVIKGVKLEIKQCFVTVETLGRNTFHPDWKPSLLLNIVGLVIQSVNDKWEIVDLAQTFIVDKEKNVEKLHKQATIQSITVHSRMTTADTPSPVIENIPCELRIITTSDAKTGLWLESSLEIIFEELNFSWTQGAWQRMVDLGMSLNACFGREIPEREGLDTQALAEAREEKMTKVSYSLTMHRFVIELLKGQKGGEDGFTCFGFGMSCTLSPLRLTTYTIKDLSGRGGDQKVECWESILNLTMQNITLRERRPAAGKEAPYNRLMTQVVDTKRTDTALPSSAPLISVQATHRQKIDCDELLKRRVPTVEVGVNLNGVQVIFDKEAWKDLFVFVVEGPLETGFAEGGLKLRSGMEAKSLEDLQKFAHVNAKFDFLAAETTFIIPPDPASSLEDLRTSALHCNVGKLTLTNQPEWPFPPFLKDALLHLPERAHNLTPAEGTIHKFQGELHRVTCTMNTLPSASGGESVSSILDPASIRVYGRYFPPESDTAKQHRVEAMLHAGEIFGHITPSNVRFFHHLEEEHRKWGIRVNTEEVERRKLNKMMQAAASGASEMKSSQVDGEKGFSVKDMTKEDLDKAQKYTIETARYALHNLHATTFVRIEKGTCEIPSLAAFDYLARQWLEEEAKEKGQALLQELSAPLEGETVVTEENLNKQITVVGLEKFEVVADNNITSQTVVFSTRGFDVLGITHPKLPASVSIRCIPGHAGKNCIEFRVSRDCSGSAPHPVSVFSHLHGLQISSTAKPGGLQKGILAILPDVQVLVQRAVAHAKEVGDKVVREDLVKYMREGFLRAQATAKEIIEGGIEGLVENVHWKVEVGECEYRYLPPGTDSSSPDAKPIGQLLLASSTKNSLETQFQDVENSLINTKLALAQSEAEKFELQNDVHQAQEQAKKVQNEVIQLSQQLATIKFTLAEAQAENDNLRSELKRAQEGGGTPKVAAKPASSGFFGRSKAK